MRRARQYTRSGAQRSPTRAAARTNVQPRPHRARARLRDAAGEPARERVPLGAEYAKVKMLSDDLLNKELVVEAKADFVVAGWESGFSEQRGITPEILDKLGMQSFMHTESCFNYPGHPEKFTPFQGLYTDLERLGRIFRVEKKAREVVAGLKKRVQAVESRAPGGERVPVFLYDSGKEAPSTAGAASRPTTSSPRPAAATSSTGSTSAGHRRVGSRSPRRHRRSSSSSTTVTSRPGRRSSSSRSPRTRGTCRP